MGTIRNDRICPVCPGLCMTDMSVYVCLVCGYTYDPAIGDAKGGIPPGVSFADLPGDWVCPECGAGKDQFKQVE